MAPLLANLLAYGQLALSKIGLLLGAQSRYPTLTLSLTPNFNIETNNATSLSVLMIMENPCVVSGGVLVVLPLIIGNVPSNRYDGYALDASDDLGYLPLYIQDSEATNHRKWHVTRKTRGDVTLSYLALPRNITITTSPGPRVDLRTDQGGLNGAALSFVPVPPAADEAIYNIQVIWNLEHTPVGTTAVWTYGEGSSALKQGSMEDLSGTYFAVGPLRSYSSSIVPNFGFYWFGEPTLFNATQLAQTVEDMFSRMASFFRDSGASYRVFIRRSAGRGFGGSAQRWSFMLEYDNMTTIDDEDMLFNLLVHEMVHNWPIMEAKEGPYEDGETAWYTEGIANYYAVVLPYRFGILSPSQVMQQLNILASAYYTSPARHMTEDEAGRMAWTNTHAQRLPYYRGAMYIFYLQEQITRASNGTRSLDDLVMALLQLKNTPGQPFGIKQWLEMVAREIGPLAKESLDAMSSGTWIMVPSADTLGSCFALRRADQFVFDLGFDERSLGERVVRGVKPGSRADIAGLKEGDRIIYNNRFLFQVADYYENEMVMSIQRDGEEHERNISWWPRSWEKVEAWEWIIKDQDEKHCSS